MTEQWQELKETITEMRDNDGTGTQQETCKFLANYMEVLEKQMQQPCEDAVSRTLVHEAITASIAESENPYEMWQRIEALPLVKPKYTDEEIDRAQAVEQAYVDKMVELAVKEAKRPKGKWIKIQSGNEDFPESIVCSRCKNENSYLDFDEHSEPIGKIFVTSKYCPNCGAEMSGGGEDETDS